MDFVEGYAKKFVKWKNFVEGYEKKFVKRKNFYYYYFFEVESVQFLDVLYGRLADQDCKSWKECVSGSSTMPPKTQVEVDGGAEWP